VGEEEFRIKDITDIHRPLAWVKRKCRRFLGDFGVYQNFDVPYLDRLGIDSGLQLYTWVTTLPSYVASLLSTRVKRLKLEVMRDKKIKWKNKRGMCSLGARIAILSFIIRNDYLVYRFKALAGKSGGFKILNAMVRKMTAKLSDDKWFVYRHISQQIQWLDLRGSSSPRDKLRIQQSVLARADKFGRVTTDYFHGIYDTVHHLVFGQG